MIRVKERGLRREEDLRMQITRKMWDLIRSSMQLIDAMGFSLKSNRIKEIVGNL